MNTPFSSMVNVSSFTQANFTPFVYQSLTYGWMCSRRSKPWVTPVSLSTLTGRFWKARGEPFGLMVFLPWNLSSMLRLKQEYTFSLDPEHTLMLSKSISLGTPQRTLRRTVELFNASRWRCFDQRSFSARNVKLVEPVLLFLGEGLN